MKWPQAGWAPPTDRDSNADDPATPARAVNTAIVSLTAPEAVKRPQFYLLWGIMFGQVRECLIEYNIIGQRFLGLPALANFVAGCTQVCSGLAVISTAKTLINECMAPAMPLVRVLNPFRFDGSGRLVDYSSQMHMILFQFAGGYERLLCLFCRSCQCREHDWTTRLGNWS